jgi:hypothetical protein
LKEVTTRGEVLQQCSSRPQVLGQGALKEAGKQLELLQSLGKTVDCWRDLAGLGLDGTGTAGRSGQVLETTGDLAGLGLDGKQKKALTGRTGGVEA